MDRYFPDAPSEVIFATWFAMRAAAARPGQGAHSHGRIAAEAVELMRLARVATTAKDVICSDPDPAAARAVKRRQRAISALEAIVSERLGIGWFVTVDGFSLRIETFGPSGAAADSQWIPGRR